jgi:hypothetical protein
VVHESESGTKRTLTGCRRMSGLWVVADIEGMRRWRIFWSRYGKGRRSLPLPGDALRRSLPHGSPNSFYSFAFRRPGGLGQSYRRRHSSQSARIAHSLDGERLMGVSALPPRRRIFLDQSDNKDGDLRQYTIIGRTWYFLVAAFAASHC